MRSSVRLQEVQEAARLRANNLRIERAGLSHEQYRIALVAAYQTWHMGRAWHWLPEWAAWPLFCLLGRRRAARFAHGWAKGWPDG